MQKMASDDSDRCCVFDLFFDIPHPAASPSKERAEIVAPPIPEKLRPEIASLYEPRSILLIERFAFPDYDSETGEYFALFTTLQRSHCISHNNIILDKECVSLTALLNRYDVNCFQLKSSYFMFSLLLDEGTRVFAHVLRYLPIHPNVKIKFDIGRRGERAMVLLTRAVGGERFYSTVLKYVLSPSLTSFLHSAVSHFFKLFQNYSRFDTGGSVKFK
jgi:hypothetical protein